MRRAGRLAFGTFVAAWSAASLAMAAGSPKVVGDWEGSLKIGQGAELRLVFYVTHKEGVISASMESVDQGTGKFPADSAVAEDGKLTLEFKKIRGTFKGTIDAKGDSIAGDWSQAGRSLPLTLKRVDPAKAKAAGVPKELAGTWEGKIQVGGGVELRVVFKVAKGKDGKLSAVFRSPDQSSQDFPISTIGLEGKAAKFAVNSIGGSFAGDLDAKKGEIVGKWKQGGASMPLTFKKTEKETEVKRPQTPKGPFPYVSEPVSYANPAGKNTLAGTLTRPKGKGPFPAAILITGSGQQDRDETLFGHKPFLVLADALTRRGIAVLRVDDRGVGGSTGEVMKATSRDFAGDVHAGIAYLKTRKEIDPKRIGLIGHSEGGLIAPMVAAEHPGDVGFIALLAAPGLDGGAILKMQSLLILKTLGAKADVLKSQGELMTELIAIATKETDEKVATSKLKEAAKRSIDALPKALRDEMDADTAGVAMDRVATFATPWFRYFLTYDPRPTLARVKCPTLAVNGEKDLQVPPRENLEAITRAFRQGGNSRLVAKELPGLNHLFQTSKTGAPSEYGQIEETMAPSALKTIADWVVEVTEAR